MRYLLDANVLSEPLRPRPNATILRLLLENQDEIATAATVFHELRYGALRLVSSRRRRDLELHIDRVIRSNIPILPYDAAAAEWHAAERARLVSIGRTPPFIDGQIAAIAATNGLTLVSANLADFSAFEGLRLEDWRS